MTKDTSTSNHDSSNSAKFQSHALATTSTNNSSVPVSPWDDTYETLDPNSPLFDSTAWIQNLRKVVDFDPEYYKPSKLGVAYRNLSASGLSSTSDFQPTILDGFWWFGIQLWRQVFKPSNSHYYEILKSMDAIMKPGELTVVLGRPGSGSTTLLKTIAAISFGFEIGPESVISYDGMSQQDINKHYRGDVIYSGETDVHYPYLKVRDTLEFAAKFRTPQNRGNIDRDSYARRKANVYMAAYGVSYLKDKIVGNDFIRGVTPGERRRVSIAETSLGGANIQCWDNATRALDAASAFELVRTLKTGTTAMNSTPIVSIFQCSQESYDLFDKVILLYEGYQIYFGSTADAKEYFVNMGYFCLEGVSTADFLTSLTDPSERIPSKGYEDKVPKTPQQFEAYWKNSPEYANLILEIDNHIEEADRTNCKERYKQSHIARQSKHIPSSSPYIVSFWLQLKYLIGRNFLLARGDPSVAINTFLTQLITGLVLGSALYNLQPNSDSLFHRGIAIFFAVLFNAFASMIEISAIFGGRPVVIKHQNYTLYRPAADALAGVISDLPVKFVSSIAFNFVYYFMVNFRREPGRFFFFWFVCFLCTLVMSHLYRCLGAISSSPSGAATPASMLFSIMILFGCFVIPAPELLGWCRWINYINPAGYIMEALLANEFAGRDFECTTFVPSGPAYKDVPIANKICSVAGSVPGSPTVSGSTYILAVFAYKNSHKWRNVGITIGFTVFFLLVFIGLMEINKHGITKGERTLFLRSSLRKAATKDKKKVKAKEKDIEEGTIAKVTYKDKVEATSNFLQESNGGIFHWRDLTFSVKNRVFLDSVDGWIKPGQLTALMGSCGGGKTTLLNCLAGRLTTGVISGTRLINGQPLDNSFERSLGFVQQQEFHLSASTVRESLRFSAYLRQPSSVSRREKEEYVEYILEVLEMSDFADALVGVPGEGLNVEQRKKLSIGVELAAKPNLLLFMDEPTSGLDSQSAWHICKLLRKLCDNGQAIICAIHQPSVLLMNEFDRLLLLETGGQTVYFGDLGNEFSTVIEYFERNGAPSYTKGGSPTEWLMRALGAAPGFHSAQDYHQVWKNSPEFEKVQHTLDEMERELVRLPRDNSPESQKKYAAPLWEQYYLVTKRVIVQNWRSPGYIYGKITLGFVFSLFNGFAFFKGPKSLSGLINLMISVILFSSQFNSLIQQMLPYFVLHRGIFEVRESPSRTFSWFAFITAQITSEIPYQIVVGTIAFFCYYYPVGFYTSAEPTNQVHSRGVLMWMFITSFFVYTSTVGQLLISFLEVPGNAANIASSFYTMSIVFCGLTVGPDVLPRFWIFMYRCSPLTYLNQGMLAVGIANDKVTCAEVELSSIIPPAGETCAQYLKDYIESFGGTLINPDDTSVCKLCPYDNTNEFLQLHSTRFSERWRNFGVLVAFIAIDIGLTVFLYWLARVPKGKKKKRE